MMEVKFQPFIGDRRDFDIPDTTWDSFVNLRHKINRFTITVAVALLASVTGIFGSRLGWVIFFSLLVTGGFLFLLTRKMANDISIRRRFLLRVQEGETFSANYEITNASQFSLRGFYFVDAFAGCQIGQIYHEESQALAPRSRRQVSVKVLCDNGMGRFRLGPLTLVVSDPLGLFTFAVVSRAPTLIEVFPQVKDLPEVRLTGTKNSDSFGIYDQLTAGTSTSFMGIRPYVAGDAVKYISWKISAKTNELMVKVFDRSVSDDVSIMVDLHPGHHMGAGNISTWQMMKELTLGLARQCLDKGNRIQVLSQNLFVPWGRGEGYWSDITLQVGLHRPRFLQESKEKTYQLEDYLELLPRGSSVFFVTTFVLELNEATYDLVEKIRARDVDVFVFMIDALTFVKGSYPLQMWSQLAFNMPNRSRTLETAKLKLNSLGVPVYILGDGKEIATSILERERL